MILSKQGYSYNDLTIVPAKVSDISSRSECNPFDEDGFLPIFTAPMSTVVDIENLDWWKQNHIHAIIPRNVDYDTRLEKMYKGYFVAYSMKEAEHLFIERHIQFPNTVRICIDVANGHMHKLISLCSNIKEFYKDKVVIMTGNIANPETIIEYDKAGIDYVRCSIGSGSACLTAPQTSVHYPIASLIDKSYEIKIRNNLKIKIVADGGIRNYGDVIKALALGADYVMIGALFAGLFESAAPWVTHESLDSMVYGDWKRDIIEERKRSIINEENPLKRFYGMSTKEAQKLIKPDGEKLKTSEGLTKIVHCNHTMKQWSENMSAYLRSAMSYTDNTKLSDFIGKVDLIINSPAEISAVNK